MSLKEDCGLVLVVGGMVVVGLEGREFFASGPFEVT
jgi:hypothetical protein